MIEISFFYQYNFIKKMDDLLLIKLLFFNEVQLITFKSLNLYMMVEFYKVQEYLS